VSETGTDRPGDQRANATRDETTAERMDRHWNEMLQELRVTQTGVQILFAFLLVLPFQQRFADLNPTSRTIYVVVVCLAALSTALTMAPVITHRFLYAKHKKDVLMTVSHRLTQASFVALGLTLTGALLLVVDMVLDHGTALLIVGAIVAVILVLWVILPLMLLRRRGRQPSNY